MRYKLLAIEGNIGAGKTTLSKMLAQKYAARLILEQFADNPFLPKFYAHPKENAFPLELFFMAERFQQLKEKIPVSDLFQQSVISDYMFTKSLIFAKVTLEEDTYQLYSRLFHIINPTLPQPDLIVYLYASVDQLQTNIKQRGRSYEQSISNDYLEMLHKTYMNYFKQMPSLRILIVDINQVDYAHNKKVFEQFCALLDVDYPKGISWRKLV